MQQYIICQGAEGMLGFEWGVNAIRGKTDVLVFTRQEAKATAAEV